MKILEMEKVDLKDKVVLVRVDFNVPMHVHGDEVTITSENRIDASVPTIKKLLKLGAKQIIVMSHLGSPKAGHVDELLSLAPVAEAFSKKMGVEIPLVADWLGKTKKDFAKESQVILLENVRFRIGEKENSAELSEKMAKLCDVFVMDAFATAHRKHASTCGVAEFAPVACAGPLFVKEVKSILKVLEKPKHPLVAIVGGAKVSTKLKVLHSLAKLADCTIVGGGIANTFVAAQGHSVGKSLYEEDLIADASMIEDAAKEAGNRILVPMDAIVAEELSQDAETSDRPTSQIFEDERMLDIGADTAKEIRHIIKEAKTILWNGPLGLFEVDKYGRGTEILAKEIANSDAYCVAGGGDTIAAIEKYIDSKDIDFISTGGGAFLKLVEGEKLPALEALERRAKA